MKLYQQLKIDLAKEIAEVKRLKAEWEAATEAANKITESLEYLAASHDLYRFYLSQSALADSEKAYQQYVDAMIELTRRVEEAYCLVPFAKTREQGKTSFFKLANI